MIRDLVNVKLFRVIKRDVLNPEPLYKTIVTAYDIEVTRGVMRRYALPIDLYDLELVEELKPTTSNIMGLIYYTYLVRRREEEERYQYSTPVRFENVLRFNIADGEWNSTLHVRSELINSFDEIVNEARDREKVKELVRLDLDKRMLQNKQELERLSKLDSNFKNIDLIPVND